MVQGKCLAQVYIAKVFIGCWIISVMSQYEKQNRFRVNTTVHCMKAAAVFTQAFVMVNFPPSIVN